MTAVKNKGAPQPLLPIDNRRTGETQAYTLEAEAFARETPRSAIYFQAILPSGTAAVRDSIEFSGFSPNSPGNTHHTLYKVGAAAASNARMSTRRQFVACLAATLPAGPVRALEAPAGPVVLTISGRVLRPNVGGSAQFDMQMLERLPQRSFVTQTPWYATPRRFTGPLLRDVLSSCGAQGSNLRATALNDYRVDLPFEDTQRFDVMLALLLDDRPMAVRDKGPLFIIYPFDSSAELRKTIYYSRSAWQLKSLEVQ